MKPAIISFCLLLAASAVLTAQTGESVNQTDRQGRKQGRWITTYPNENILYEGFFVDDVPAGEMKRYYEDETLMSVMDYDNDGKTVMATIYYPNGFIASKGRYVNRMKEGKWLFYSPRIEGYLFNEEEYTGNMKNGLSVKYYPDSTTAERIYYLNDIRHGEWIMYRENGTLMLKAGYSGGKLNGKYEVFFENGKPEMAGEYKNGLREGAWFIYKDDGTIRFEIEYLAGTPKNRDLDIYETEYIEEIEAKYKGKIADPETSGEIW